MAGGLAARAGVVERLLERHFAQTGLDRLDGHVHVQQFADFFFVKMQDGHAGDSVGIGRVDW